MYKRLLSDEHGSLDVEAGGELRAAPGRRRRSTEERRLIVEEALEPGASVAWVARRHGVNANQVFGWRKVYESGSSGVAGRRDDAAAGDHGGRAGAPAGDA